jgi:hypothetical protein
MLTDSGKQYNNFVLLSSYVPATSHSTLAAAFLFSITSTLKMETERSSETAVSIGVDFTVSQKTVVLFDFGNTRMLCADY